MVRPTKFSPTIFGIFLTLLTIVNTARSQSNCEVLLDDYESVRKLGGTAELVSNPGTDNVNSSSGCAKYTHASNQWEFLNFNYPFSDADDFKTGIKSFTIMVYSPFPGIPVSVQFKTSKDYMWPDAWHSIYISYTTKTNAWEKLTLIPFTEGLSLAADKVDQLVLVFHDGFTNTGYFEKDFTLYYDNLSYQYSAAGIISQPISQTISANAPASFSLTAQAESYQWEENNGTGFKTISDAGIYSGSQTTQLSISSAPFSMNNYSYRCKLTKDGCSIYSATVKLSINKPPVIPICTVTADSTFKYNQVIWDKSSYTTAGIDSFVVYRDDSNDSFKRIGAVASGSEGLYKDLQVSPSSSAYRYKITAKTSSGQEAELSLYHTTVFLTYLGEGVFFWTPYEIENSNVTVTNYEIYRDSLSSGHFKLIFNAPGYSRAYADSEITKYPEASYYIRAILKKGCGGSFKTGGAVNATRSNVRRSKLVSGITEYKNIPVNIYPNPASQKIYFESSVINEIENLTILNNFGQSVNEWKKSELQIKSGKIEMNISHLAKGIYFIKATGKDFNLVKKIVVE